LGCFDKQETKPGKIGYLNCSTVKIYQLEIGAGFDCDDFLYKDSLYNVYCIRLWVSGRPGSAFQGRTVEPYLIWTKNKKIFKLMKGSESDFYKIIGKEPE
jgi:hypothetical protein